MKKLIYSFLMTFAFFACEDSYIDQNKPESLEFLKPLTFTSTTDLKPTGFHQQKEAIIDLQILMEKMLQDNNVSRELYHLGRTHHYSDYYISLKDLLYPDKSELYNNANLNSDLKGSFKSAFELEIQNHPEMVNLIAYVSSFDDENNIGMYKTNNGNNDTELYVYCPYCLDVPEEQTDEPTIVPTTVEATDEAIGNKLLSDGSIVGVNVNDDYAYQNLSYIITTSNDVFTVPC